MNADDATILLTGATDGIGRAAALMLAARGARLLLHGRSDERLADVARACAAAPSVQSVRADFSDLADVRAMVDAIAKEPRLVVINNAGVGAFAGGPERQTTKDGFELCWGVNFLAPFALTEWLLAAGAKVRAIVNVASIGQQAVDTSDANLERSYEPWRAYRQSKLAMIAWGFELAARAGAPPVTSLHPGTFLATKMVTEAGVAPRGELSSGADAILHALDATLAGKTGTYFNVKHETHADAAARDAGFQRWLQAYAANAVAPFGSGLAIPS